MKHHGRLTQWTRKDLKSEALCLGRKMASSLGRGLLADSGWDFLSAAIWGCVPKMDIGRKRESQGTGSVDLGAREAS